MADEHAAFAEVRERELATEAESWDLADIADAGNDDIPVVDIAPYLRSGDTVELERLAAQVRFVGENTGFHLLIGHGIPDEVGGATFGAGQDFLTQPEAVKRSMRVDGPAALAGGIGYLPFRERRLPRRVKGNLNEAILFKQDRDLRLSDNPWPDERLVPRFRAAVERYAAEIEAVALALLPIYARALDLPAQFFAPAFRSPFYRLRITAQRE